MKIIWEKTGDELLLDPHNHEFAKFWVDSLNLANNNKFQLQSCPLNLNCVNQLQQDIQVVHNIILTKFKINDFEYFLNKNLFDQQVLNFLHCTWTKIGLAYPMMPTVLKKMDIKYLNAWDRINTGLHDIERDFVLHYASNKQYWEVENVFGPSVLDFNRCNIVIKYSQRGRHLFDKWAYFDTNIYDTDTNNYIQVGAEIKIDLNRPIYQDAPINYKQFCFEKSLTPIGCRLNLANFRGYSDELHTIREVLFRNITNENNQTLFEF